MALHLLIFCWSCSLLLTEGFVASEFLSRGKRVQKTQNVADADRIIYPFTSTCAVEGSSVTLPCTFTPLKSATDQKGKTVYLKIVRVVWCKNHVICQGITPTVYDSNNPTLTSPYQYLGDLERNCTLLIRNIRTNDEATFRFRMEANDPLGHFTNQTGVNVTVRVPGSVQMKVSRSGNHTEVRRGGTVTLSCSSLCTTHQLEVTWFRDGHALSESGPALQLGPLTAGDSGNYMCELKAKSNTRSPPYSLTVEDQEDGDFPLAAAATGGVLLAAIALIAAAAAVIIMKRKRAAAADNSRAEEKLPDGRREAEDVNYTSVHFKHKQPPRQTKRDDDAVIYSSVSGRN